MDKYGTKRLKLIQIHMKFTKEKDFLKWGNKDLNPNQGGGQICPLGFKHLISQEPTVILTSN